MAHIELYTTPTCPFCLRAKSLLKRLDLEFTDYDVSFDSALQKEMVERSGGFTVPQIFIDNASVGGSDELVALWRSGKLSALVGDSNPAEEVHHVA